jgi:hypothetical protein
MVQGLIGFVASVCANAGIDVKPNYNLCAGIDTIEHGVED